MPRSESRHADLTRADGSGGVLSQSDNRDAPPSFLPLRFTVPGEPVAWARAGRRGGFSFTPTAQRHFGSTVRMSAVAALPGGHELLDGPLSLRVVCTFARPDSKCRRKDNPDRRGWCIGRKDADNCAKIVSDSLNGVVWKDDRQVVVLNVLKLLGRKGEPPSVYVEVDQCGEPEGAIT